MTKLDIDALRNLVDHAGVAIRIRQRLQPAGGAGDKVFPPTYSTGENTLKYAGETRRVDGKDVPTVLLDSVASQANRMEEALLAAWQKQQLGFPVIGVDFTGDPALLDLGAITSLQAPHRIADAILRDATSVDGKTLFRDLPEGKASRAKDAKRVARKEGRRHARAAAAGAPATSTPVERKPEPAVVATDGGERPPGAT
jgi:CRISPR-associated protein Csb1